MPPLQQYQVLSYHLDITQDLTTGRLLHLLHTCWPVRVMVHIVPSWLLLP
jgi:hypothetical protein